MMVADSECCQGVERVLHLPSGQERVENQSLLCFIIKEASSSRLQSELQEYFLDFI